jgi:class 3 adenylate cyclase
VDDRRVERRLAAILAADVGSYSRLMGADEVGTLRALKAHRKDLVDPAVLGHCGRIVKTTGDRLLIEFPSVPLQSRNHLFLESEPCFGRFLEEVRAFSHR